MGSVRLGKRWRSARKKVIGKKKGDKKRNIGKLARFQEVLEGSAGQATIDISTSLTDEDKFLARLSNQAYEHAKGTKLQTLGNYSLVDAASSNNHVVYRNHHTNHTVVAFRGTDPSKSGDLVADAHIAMGTQKLSKRFKEAEDTYKRLRSQLAPGSEITLTGHSLGGALANHVSKTFDEHATTFNPGAGVGDLFTKGKKDGTRRVLRTKSDVVSKLIAVRDTITGGDPNSEVINLNEKLGIANAHGIKNFIS